MINNEIQELCRETWKPFQRQYPHLAEDAKSAAVLAVLEALSVNSDRTASILERIARSAMLDYIEQNS